MTPLDSLLRRRLRLTGPMTVAAFMQEALLHPEHGYYRRQPALGAAGDFVTAPEVSQMFGELLGLWCLDYWERMGAPDPVLLVELGPGRGTLIADALRATRLRPAFHRALRLHLVEASPVLRQRQREALAPFAGQIAPAAWHETLAALPDDGTHGAPLLLLANEFFDALPVHQFERGPEGWRERVVVEPQIDAPLAFTLAPAGPQLGLLGRDRREAPVGSLAEISPAGLSVADEIGRRLAQQGGAALLVDYGYGAGGGWSLQAVQGHRRLENPLTDPGLVDLSVHVDFMALARAATQGGARAHGPLAQGAFLEALGIRLRAQRLTRDADAVQRAAVERALARLLDPQEMGTLFQALALTAPDGPAPAGFTAPGG
ncbi:ATP synthase subunit beta [Hypericibacter adhaerens]|jgi:NADH dehydrogenase [ubiquinone] 1 alpha subcomplex assembly factor 7|uniref:ATP synthase subunit beta n=1 Tax=Hypericibacter adhaerens TaxID=2602016 RepID=A0A5J6MTM7_9PROT|nr:SAM-dependent methyltransferase [Hypericibacter adhaerens]QEX21032.1 ATP synthase subunit beta [Hypericibacter adhaerens]